MNANKPNVTPLTKGAGIGGGGFIKRVTKPKDAATGNL